MRNLKLGRGSMAFAATALSLCLGGMAQGQSNYLINTQTGLLPLKNSWEVRATGTFFGNDEKLGYFGLNGLYGLGNGWAVSFNGGFAAEKTKTFGGLNVRTGGTDVELQAMYAPAEWKGFMVAAGVSKPSTPNQDEAFFTARGVYGYHFDGFDGYLGASGVFREDSTLAAITVGVESKPSHGFSVLGEFNGVVTGDNTYNSNGQTRRVSTYGVGVRYRKPESVDMMSFLLAWTNGLGSTTGFSLTPGLNNSGALFVGVSFSR